MSSITHSSAESLGKCIFVVEDDGDVARIIRTVLQDFGFEPVMCRTAAELYRQLKTREPDLCIVDLGLPDADGMEIVKELQAKHDCGIVILTGRGYVSDRIMGLELGADDYVVKPFEPRELVARVRSILRRSRKSAAQDNARLTGIAHFKGWHFNVSSNMLVADDGTEWNLSTAEAQLLTIFLERPNRILTREQLLGERDISPFDRSIDVRISRLRRKLEPDPLNPKIIRTVYGAGYLFALEVKWE